MDKDIELYGMLSLITALNQLEEATEMSSRFEELENDLNKYQSIKWFNDTIRELKGKTKTDIIYDDLLSELSLEPQNILLTVDKPKKIKNKLKKYCNIKNNKYSYKGCLEICNNKIFIVKGSEDIDYMKIQGIKFDKWISYNCDKQNVYFKFIAEARLSKPCSIKIVK